MNETERLILKTMNETNKSIDNIQGAVQSFRYTGPENIGAYFIAQKIVFSEYISKGDYIQKHDHNRMISLWFEVTSFEQLTEDYAKDNKGEANPFEHFKVHLHRTPQGLCKREIEEKTKSCIRRCLRENGRLDNASRHQSKPSILEYAHINRMVDALDVRQEYVEGVVVATQELTDRKNKRKRYKEALEYANKYKMKVY